MERGKPLATSAVSGDAPVPPQLIFEGSGFVRFVQNVAVKRGWELFRHIFALGLIAWAPSMMVAWLVRDLFPENENPDVWQYPVRTLIGGLLLAPLSETMGMRYLFYFLRKISNRLLVISWLSALIWGALHFLYAGWGVHAVWPFFILSLCYLRLEPISIWRAIWLTTLIHAICNGMSLGLQVVLDRMTDV